MRAEHRHWHARHFCCWWCDQPLAGTKYVTTLELPTKFRKMKMEKEKEMKH